MMPGCVGEVWWGEGPLEPPMPPPVPATMPPKGAPPMPGIGPPMPAGPRPMGASRALEVQPAMVEVGMEGVEEAVVSVMVWVGITSRTPPTLRPQQSKH